MSGWLLPLGATAATGLATYLSCVRPMLRARGRHAGVAPRGAGTGELSQPAAVPGADGEQIRRLTEEVQLLRRELEPRESTGSTP